MNQWMIGSYQITVFSNNYKKYSTSAMNKYQYLEYRHSQSWKDPLPVGKIGRTAAFDFRIFLVFIYIGFFFFLQRTTRINEKVPQINMKSSQIPLYPSSMVSPNSIFLEKQNMTFRLRTIVILNLHYNFCSNTQLTFKPLKNKPIKRTDKPLENAVQPEIKKLKHYHPTGNHSWMQDKISE